MKLFVAFVRIPLNHDYQKVQVLANSPAEAKEQLEIEYGEGSVARYPQELA
ncbi:hypothetical protein [Polynucleobacter sp. MWH-UH2A]|uniref:hypothetical protein n=1 Tax=Polynucleobacter sp. MWH-UH2A TaxID=1855617 RepID=UPI001BFDEEEA|nr:hypothetical protein [Polynucleobacter sp. MWH-UH2A]QWD63392.1 hypothetical protein IC571_06735 [Polynucleobacter sp. MWH-UH2A]